MRYSGMDANLPDLNQLDREGLLAVLIAQHHQLLETQQRLASRESEVAHLKLLIVKLQRLQFGRRSEKVQRQIEQLELRLEELEANKAAENTSDAPAAVTPTFGTKPRRGPLPEHLPREVRRREPKETVCPGCGGELRKKESDRIVGVVAGLSALGADIEVDGDDLRITGGTRLRCVGREPQRSDDDDGESGRSGHAQRSARGRHAGDDERQRAPDQ